MEISFNPKDMLEKDLRRLLWSDLSFWALVASNLLVIVWAVIENWPPAVIIWVYWSQSVIIGILWFTKILCLRRFSTKDYTVNDKPVQPAKETKIRTAFFFLAHYGLFHFFYAFFLFDSFRPPRTRPLLVMGGIFLLYQCFSFFYNRKWDDKQTPNIGRLFVFPYARIVPMHLTILLGGILTGGKFGGWTTLVLFMLLKTVADVLMHVMERRGFGDVPGEQET